MYVGALELDVLLGDVHSLKQKRSVVRPVVAADPGHVVEVLERCERLVAARPELQLLSSRFRDKLRDSEYTAVAVSLLGASALLLACLGIIGLVTYAVCRSLRRHLNNQEFGQYRHPNERHRQ